MTHYDKKYIYKKSIVFQLKGILRKGVDWQS